MAEHATGSLHELRNKPFELLREMERRSRNAASGSRDQGDEGEEDPKGESDNNEE